MPPADPIEFRIVQNLQAALLAISVATGYHHDVGALAVKLDPDQDVEALIAPDGTRPFLILEVKPEAWDYSEMPNMVQLACPLTVHWINDIASGTNAPTDDDWLLAYFKACADIEQAVTQDITRGDLAHDTRITKRVFDERVMGTQIWAMVDLEVNIRRTFGRPNG